MATRERRPWIDDTDAEILAALAIAIPCLFLCGLASIWRYLRTPR